MLSATTLRHVKISIHALHEESDGFFLFAFGFDGISIHALHEESDPSRLMTLLPTALFQSTLSMRRATIPPSKRHVHT